MIADQKILTIPGSSASEVSTEKIGLKAGLIICTSLITYFMIMKYLNFMHSPVAWALNFIILFTGIILTYRYYRSATKLNVDYFPGLVLGCITTAATVLPFTLFVFIFFSLADQLLLSSLKDNVLFMGEQITPLRAAVATFVEGISSGVIISFILMQYYKSGFRRKRGERRMHG